MRAPIGTPDQVVVSLCVIIVMIIAVFGRKRAKSKPAAPQVGERWIFTSDDPWGKVYEVEILELKAGWVRFAQVYMGGYCDADSKSIERFMENYTRKP